jgi:hypothetical protein
MILVAYIVGSSTAGLIGIDGACMLISGQSPIDPFHRNALRTETLEVHSRMLAWPSVKESHLTK